MLSLSSAATVFVRFLARKRWILCYFEFDFFSDWSLQQRFFRVIRPNFWISWQILVEIDLSSMVGLSRAWLQLASLSWDKGWNYSCVWSCRFCCCFRSRHSCRTSKSFKARRFDKLRWLSGWKNCRLWHGEIIRWIGWDCWISRKLFNYKHY